MGTTRERNLPSMVVKCVVRWLGEGCSESRSLLEGECSSAQSELDNRPGTRKQTAQISRFNLFIFATVIS